MRYILILVGWLVLTIFGCTDATFSKWRNLNSSAKITCISGGKVVLDTESTGKVQSEKNSDGYYFVEKSTNDSLEVSCETIIIRTKE